jgi:hypothetical protein
MSRRVDTYVGGLKRMAQLIVGARVLLFCSPCGPNSVKVAL